MAAPNLSIAVEPAERGTAMYLPLAPAKSTQKGIAKVVLRLVITNNESTDVTVTGIRFGFPGTLVLPIAMKGVQLVLDPAGSTTAAEAQGTIPAGSSATWSNGRVDLDTGEGENWHENMVFTSFAPTQVQVEVTCAGYRSPAKVTRRLAPYTSPTPTGALLFPFAAGDLRSGEYVVTSGRHWANGGAAGTQIYAHDIGIQAVNSGTWSQLLSGKPSSKNDSYRIWGKPVRAMADGLVESWLATMDDNTVLGAFPDPTPSPVSGNHFWIRHGDVYALYAHLQKDSLPAALMVKGAPVTAGQSLGLAGNSGNSTNPHTHIHMVKGSKSGALRGIPFRNAWVLDHAAYTPPGPDDPWVPIADRGVSRDEVSIWPASTTPGFKIPAAGIARSGNWANSFWVSTSRAAFEAKAQQLFDEKGRRLVHVHTYVDGGTRYWMGIARSGNWSSAFWISSSRAAFQAKAQQLFDEKGQRLTFVHTYVDGGTRRWIGIARGANWSNSFWVSEGFAAFNEKAQQLFDEKGRRLVHVHTYVQGSKRYWAGIAAGGDWANSFWLGKDLDSFNRAAQDLFEDKGRRLMVVEFLDS